MPFELMQYIPMQAVVGGVFIGAASGIYMLLAHRIAGNSGALKSVVVGPIETTKAALTLGLIATGSIMNLVLPALFEAPSAPSLGVYLGGFVVGVGTTLGNGCTSGHGLCGLSRFSIRSLVAVPVFMGCAIASATIKSGVYTFGAPVVAGQMDGKTVTTALYTFGLLAAMLLPAMLLQRKDIRDTYVGGWVGCCAGTGLSIGGMVRPSVITGALTPANFDSTLWVLFVTALSVTFVFYRIAQRSLVHEACAASGGVIDRKLVLGAALFGLGWGYTGYCPGPLLSTFGANPSDLATLLCLLGVINGMQATARVMASFTCDEKGNTSGAPAQLLEKESSGPHYQQFSCQLL